MVPLSSRMLILSLLTGIFILGCGSKDQATETKKQSPAEKAIVKPQSEPTPSNDGHLLEAKVIKAIHVFGPNTTYLELQSNNETFWIASSKIDTKAGDRVRYSAEEATKMVKFNSRALGRTFDKILFLPKVEVMAAVDMQTDTPAVKKADTSPTENATP